MLSVSDRHVIARESNVVRVDFNREPDPPTPCFPGANGLRPIEMECDKAVTVPHIFPARQAGIPPWLAVTQITEATGLTR